MHYFFYVFSALVVLFSLAAVLLRNPVHSVLSLIGAFLSSALLFIIFSAEFMAMVLAIVYVGAIAILFLFVVIMLNVADVYKEVNRPFKWVCGGLSSLIFLSVMLILFIYLKNHLSVERSHVIDLGTIAHALYSDYLVIFELAGIILLVAMVGAISLTISKKAYVKRQNVYSQVSRSSMVDLIKVEPYKGVNIDD